MPILRPCQAFLFLVLSASTIIAAQGDNECADRSNEETNITRDYRVGIDLSDYTLVPGQASYSMEAGRNAAQEDRVRMEAFNNAFDLIDQLGLSYNIAKENYLKGYEALRSSNDVGILEQEIRIYKESETLNWESCGYVYEVELAVPQVPGLGRRLDGEIHQALQALLDELYEKRQGDSIDISLDVLVAELSNSKEFQRLIAELKDDPDFARNLKFRDDDTQALFRQFQGVEIELKNYARGQYRINAVLGCVIRGSVVPAVKTYLNTHDLVRVTCIGNTDLLKVRGISYQGYADLRRPLGERLPFHMPGASEPPRSQLIRNNNELSFARGFEGIRALAVAIGDQFHNPRLALSYSGEGELPSARRADPGSRRITFRIEFDREE